MRGMMNDFLTLGPDGRAAEHECKTLDYKRDLSGSEGVCDIDIFSVGE